MAGTVGSLGDLTSAGFGQAGVSETGAQETNTANLIGSVAPLATSWSGPMVGTAVAYKAPTTSASGGNIFSEFDSFAHSTFNTVTSLGEGALKDMGKSIVSAVTAPGKLGIGLYELGKATYTNHENDATLNVLDSQQQSMNDNYKSGRISLGQYNAGMQDIAKQRQQLSQKIDDNEKLVTHGGTYATQGDIGTVEDIFAIATAGESESITQALSTGDSAIVNKLLASGSVASENLLRGGQILDGVMGKLSEGLDKAVSWNGLFGKTAEDSVTQEASNAATDNIGKGLEPVVKDITNEAQNNAGANATVLQKAKSVAVGLLIKRPLIYNTAVGQAQDFYHELSTGEYGDAAKEAGLMGLMTLAGGPVGAAMKYGGKIVQGAARQIFAEPSFIDTLSQYVGNKEAKGIYNDLAQRMRDDPEAGERVAQALKVMEDTNVKASNGSVVGAVQRIVDYHTLSMPDTPLSGMSHHEFVDNLSNLGRIAEEFGKAGDRGELLGDALRAYQDNRYAFGRITASSKNWLAGQLAEADGKSASLMGTEETAPTEEPNNVPKQPTTETTDLGKNGESEELANSLSNRDTLKVDDKVDLVYQGSGTQTKTKLSGTVVDYKPGDKRNFVNTYNTKVSTISDLPREIKGAKPRYSYGSKQFTLNFKDDATKALYIVAGKTPSSKDSEYLKYLKNEFPDKSVEDLRSMGQEVRSNIKNIAKDSNESSINVDSHSQVKNKTTTVSKDVNNHVSTGGRIRVKTTDGQYVNVNTEDVKSAKVTREKETSPAIENNVSAPSDQDVQQYAQSFGISEDKARQELSQHMPTRPEGQSQLTTTVNEPSGTKIAARQQVMQALDEQYGTHTPILNNVTLRNQIDKIVRTVDDTDEMVKQIGQIKAQSALAGVPKDLANDIRKNGYTVIAPNKIDAPYVRYNETNGKLATKFAKSDSNAYGSNYFQKSSQGLPVLKDVGAALTRVGLSPDSADGAVYSIFNQNMRNNLSEMVNDIKVDVPIGENRVDAIINKLSNYVKSKASITDMRQLNMKEVRTTLNVDTDTAKKIMGAINEAMLKVPLQLRGLGDRIVDYNYKINPFAGKYARIQSAGKFAYNPFFRWQQVTTTEMFAQAEAGGKAVSYPIWNKVVDTFFPGQSEELNNTITALKTNGIFEGGMSGYAAEDQAAGKIGTHLLPSEERSMAGLVNSMAAKAGVDVNTFIQQNPNEVTDTLRSFVQYPKGGNFINSPLARTINTAFFPARYNMKVAGMAARVLSEQNPFVQVAVIQGMLKAHDWLNSNEGLAWRQTNADAIGVFAWVSPLYSLGYVYDILGGKPNSIGEFGSLGGLPFGIISQLLDAEGVIQINTPYVSPENGQVLPDYIPKTTIGAASAALQSIVGSLFTYPGAVAGLPSKTGVIRSAVDKFTGATTTKDFSSVTPTNLTPAEQKEQSVWSQGQSGQVSANGNVVNLYKGPNIPVIPPSMRDADLQSRIDANAKPTTSSSTTKKKESQYTPAALPPTTTVNPLTAL